MKRCGYLEISLFSVVMLAVPALPGFAQVQQAADDTKLLEFEVASVRPSNPDQGFVNAVTPSLRVDPGRNLTFVQITLRDLIMLAYSVGAPQIQGPSFINGTPENVADRFDIVARVPEGATRDQAPLMLRALLAERFHLRLHRESKSMQIYALEQGKGPLKMKESQGNDWRGAVRALIWSTRGGH